MKSHNTYYNCSTIIQEFYPYLRECYDNAIDDTEKRFVMELWIRAGNLSAELQDFGMVFGDHFGGFDTWKMRQKKHGIR